MFELGVKAKDSVTGFSGTITARAEYYGDDHDLYRIENEKRTRWVSADRVELVKD